METGAPRRAAVMFAALLGLALNGCGGSSPTHSGTRSTGTGPGVASVPPHTASTPPPPAYPVVLGAASLQGTIGWTPAVTLRGRTAAWLARVPGEGEPITMLRFDQSMLKLALHSGTVDPGGSGWQYGPSIGPAERPNAVSGFEGGFMFSDHQGGFLSQGRLELGLTPGLASIVTYSSGTTDIGTWKGEVPASGQPIFSVRQNLSPLVDQGRAASNVTSCVIACWGPTLGGGLVSARGALGVDSAGRLIYAGGERLSVSALANALVSAGVQRAAELDINPEWVNLYLYAHHGPGSPISVIPMIPGQPGIPGQLLTPYSRDFFTVLAR
jgi:hypothetical protein